MENKTKEHSKKDANVSEVSATVLDDENSSEEIFNFVLDDENATEKIFNIEKMEDSIKDTEEICKEVEEISKKMEENLRKLEEVLNYFKESFKQVEGNFRVEESPKVKPQLPQSQWSRGKIAAPSATLALGKDC